MSSLFWKTTGEPEQGFIRWTIEPQPKDSEWDDLRGQREEGN